MTNINLGGSNNITLTIDTRGDSVTIDITSDECYYINSIDIDTAAATVKAIEDAIAKVKSRQARVVGNLTVVKRAGSVYFIHPDYITNLDVARVHPRELERVATYMIEDQE